MNKLLLVSSGLGALQDFVEREPKSLKLLFIPTAGNTSHDPLWVDRDRKTIKQLGFQFREFDIADKTPHQLGQALSKIDVVFVSGGNTFYLLDMMQRCNFSEYIKTLLNHDVQYVGASAGAVVAGPDIKPVSGLDDPKDAPELKSTIGLGLVNFVIIPHVNLSDRESGIEQIKQDFGSKFTLIPINDEQSVIVNQFDDYQIIDSKQYPS